MDHLLLTYLAGAVIANTYVGLFYYVTQARIKVSHWIMLAVPLTVTIAALI